MRSHIKKLKETSETSLAGTIWTPNEEEKLIDSLKNKKELSEIAKEHKRTIGGIKIRAQSIALRMIQAEGKTTVYLKSELLEMSLQMRLKEQKPLFKSMIT